MNKFATETVSHVWTKPMMQQVRRDFKRQGLNITKTEDGNGYELKLPNGLLLLKAMNGSQGYLVRHVYNLFA
jgi:hypothetical protein